MDIPTMRHRLHAKGIQVTNNDLAFTLLVLNDAVLEGMATEDLHAISKLSPQRFDIQKMQSLLLAKGIRISDDDPLFTLLAMNEIALEEMRKEYQKKLSPITALTQSWQPKTSIYLQSGACCFVAFTLGAFCRSNPSWLQGTLIALTIVLSWCLLYLLNPAARPPRKSITVLPYSSELVQKHALVITPWTEEEFMRATNAVESRLSARTLAACFAVLIHGDDIKSSSIKDIVWPAQVRRAIRLLEKHKTGARN